MSFVQSKQTGMNAKHRSVRSFWHLAALLALAATGCQNIVDEVPAAKPFKGPAQVMVGQSAKAGVSVGAGPVSLIQQQVVAYKVTPRPDPFALQQTENQYEVKENNERIFATTGSFFGPVFIPRPESVAIERVEPQPFRRLAGVLVGDSVMAIIDMGDGSPMQVIRPGMQIPNSPWRVISIDSEKAILRRGGKVRPNEIVVRLQSPSSSPGGNPVIQPGQPQNPGQPGGGPGRRGKFGGPPGGGGGGAIN